jgi:hypothetical protein
VRFMDPTVAGGDVCASYRREVMPPLRQYFSRLRKGRRVHRCPQKARIAVPLPFPLQTGRFLRATAGATMPITDPLAGPPG